MGARSQRLGATVDLAFNVDFLAHPPTVTEPSMEPATEFDLVVIGGGPGGYGAALYATSAGLSVAIVEMAEMGGTCLNRGCIPAKAFLETAAVQRHVAHAAEFGIESSAPVVNFVTAQNRKQKIVDGIVKSLPGFMKSKKITILEGTGTLGADHTVTITTADGGTSSIHGTNVVLAAGSVPRTIPGFEPAGPAKTKGGRCGVGQLAPP